MDKAFAVFKVIDVTAETVPAPAAISAGVVILTSPDVAVMEEKRKAAGKLKATEVPVKDTVPEIEPVPVTESGPVDDMETEAASMVPLFPMFVAVIDKSLEDLIAESTFTEFAVTDTLPALELTVPRLRSADGSDRFTD
jgi:hypothetical protein